MTTTEELIRILEGDENEEFLSDEEFDIDVEVIIFFITYLDKCILIYCVVWWWCLNGNFKLRVSEMARARRAMRMRARPLWNGDSDWLERESRVGALTRS